MLRVFFSPIVGLADQIQYTFDKNKITATYKGTVDTFDFTGMPDGQLELSTLETTLELSPIISAERIDGVLYVELLNPISDDATEFQRFPEWIEVGEENGEV